jgi:serine/threonine protein kinase
MTLRKETGDNGLRPPAKNPAEKPTGQSSAEIPVEIAAKYDGLTEVHRGGMGVVYRGRHRHLDRWDAIKLILPYQLHDDSRRQRFLREARIASSFNHRHIVHTHDFAIAENGTPYLVMELIKGRMLASLLQEEGPPPLPRALVIAQQITLALGYIHQQGYVHRDVSTKNLMLERENPPWVKLVDLGIAKRLEDESGLTRSDTFLFNARYASPEHFKSSRDLDPRSDLYSCGVVLYELFTGQRPFLGESLEEMVACHLFEAPLEFTETDPEGRLPAPLRQILRRTLEKDPGARFQRAEDLTQELEKILTARPRSALSSDTGATTASRKALLDFALRAEKQEAVQNHSQRDHGSPDLGTPIGPHGFRTQSPDFLDLGDSEAPSSAATSIPSATRLQPGFALRRLRMGLSLGVVAVMLLFSQSATSWRGEPRLPAPQLFPASGLKAEPQPSNSPDLSWYEVFEMAEYDGILDPEFPYVVQIATASDPQFTHPVLELGVRAESLEPADVQRPRVVKPVPPPHPVKGPVQDVLGDGSYLWRVGRQNHYGELWGFSSVGRFEFDATPAPPPEILTGEDRPTMDRSPTFTWGAPLDAAEVQIQVALDQEFENILWNETLPASPQMSWRVPASDPLPEGDIYWRLGSVDMAKNPVQYTPPKHFSVDITPPELPVPRTLEGPLGDPRPLFQWTLIDDAASYEIVLARGEDLQNIFFRKEVSTPSFRPQNALPEERVAWWVRSRDEAGNQQKDFSHGGILELDYTNPPTPPALCTTKALTNEAQPWLEWTATEDTASYHLELSLDDLFTTLYLDVPDLPSGPGAAWKPASRLPDGGIFWRVLSQDPAGNRSPYSKVCRLLIDTIPPKTPTLQAVRPRRAKNPRPTLNWSDEAEAVSYSLEVASDPSFKQLLPIQQDHHTNRFLPTRDFPEGELFWRVASRDEAENESIWSTVNQFEIDITPPDKPKPREMSPNPTRERRPQLIWGKVLDAQTYRVQVAREASFNQIILDETATDNTLKPPRLFPEGDIFWRVQSFDAVGNPSEYSAVSWFEIDSTPPAAARLDPISEPIREPRLTLRWQPVSDVDTYLVQIDRDASFGAPREEITDHPWLELHSLSEGTWFWRVESRDSAGNRSPFSASGQFQVDRTAPPPPRLIPVDRGQGLFPYLHWDPVSDVASYMLQLSFDPDFNDLLDEIEVESTWFQIDRAFPPGRVYWRVASCDSAGNGGRFGVPGSFDLF